MENLMRSFDLKTMVVFAVLSAAAHSSAEEAKTGWSSYVKPSFKGKPLSKLQENDVKLHFQQQEYKKNNPIHAPGNLQTGKTIEWGSAHANDWVTVTGSKGETYWVNKSSPGEYYTSQELFPGDYLGENSQNGGTLKDVSFGTQNNPQVRKALPPDSKLQSAGTETGLYNFLDFVSVPTLDLKIGDNGSGSQGAYASKPAQHR